MIDLDTVASAGSFEAALHAAGGAALGGRGAARRRRRLRVLRRCARPGHHAERDRAMGFCLFNNVAVAAAHAIAACGAERVLILDWDVHHGNGTEAIFAASTEVLYASIHQWPLYPGTGAADVQRRAARARATRSTCRSRPGRATRSSSRSSSTSWSPSRARSSRGLIAISAGYDAHRDDPLAACVVDEDGYARHDRGDARRSPPSSASRCSSASRAATTAARSAARSVATVRSLADDRAGAWACRRRSRAACWSASGTRPAT